MASNDNNSKRKLEEEAETSVVRKRLRLSDNDGGDDDSSDSQHEDMEEDEVTEEEVSLEESSMNQVDTFEDKLVAKHGNKLSFGDDSDTTSLSSEPSTPETSSTCVCSDPDGSDGNFWM
jgi:hypothetical protein